MNAPACNPCQLCGKSDFRILPYYYLLNGTKVHGVRCASCGLVTVAPMPTKEAISALYNEEYFKGDYNCGHQQSYEEESFSELHRDVLERFVSLKPSGRFLEVGAAGGKFLLKAKQRGYEVMGVEVSPEACRIAEKIGVPHFCGELKDARLPDGSFDLAYLGDVLEHLPQPYDALCELNRILAPGGVVGLACPTNIGLLSSVVGLKVYSLLGKERFAPIPPYHLYEFTAHHLKKLLEKAGFEVVVVVADIIPPWRIMLRGSMLEKIMKAAFHWPNYLITKFSGKMGDRVMVFARKR